MLNNLENIILMTQEELFKSIENTYSQTQVVQNKYILVKGSIPVLLVAHLDTVHKDRVSVVCKNEDVWMAPEGIGGDDRCGVYALTQLYKKDKPWLLFTCDEEIGMYGAEAFARDIGKIEWPEFKDIKFIIEIDRKGDNDCVFYDCWNPEFQKFIESFGFITQYGSCSDISIIAPAMGTAAVNLSSGYYEAHTRHEYIVISELENIIRRVSEILAASKNEPKYKYKEWRPEKRASYDYGFYDYLDYDYEYGDQRTVFDYLEQIEKEIYCELIEKNYFTENELDQEIVRSGAAILYDLYDEYECFEKTEGLSE